MAVKLNDKQVQALICKKEAGLLMVLKILSKH